MITKEHSEKRLCRVDEPESEKYEIDIDGDGTKETVCNYMTPGDGHREVYIFRQNGDKAEIGYVDWLKYGIKDLFYWGCNAVQCEYNDDSGKINIYYCSRESDQDGFSPLEVGFDWICFTDWDGENFPCIDMEKAYELYGEE